ncbi:MAG: hypothetical protein NVS4B11_15980 [Ktedonobacteraceae bacterium]
MVFPYEHYEKLTEPLTVYYPTGEEIRARWALSTVQKAGSLLTELLVRPLPEVHILLVTDADWSLAPRDAEEEVGALQPYWTAATTPPSLVVPSVLESIWGEQTQEKLAFMLYHEITLAFLEDDPRPWPDDYPLWADEWQLKFAALWLSQRLDGQQGVVNKDLHEQFAEIFEPEPDGKTPVTVRGFDWYEDTVPEDYLEYELLLEQFAADLLANYEPEIWPRFLALYRVEREKLLSDDVTIMFASVLGPNGTEWLENLVYF